MGLSDPASASAGDVGLVGVDVGVPWNAGTGAEDIRAAIGRITRLGKMEI